LILAASVAAFQVACVIGGAAAYGLGIVLGILGLVMLTVWALICRDCRLLRTLRDIFLIAAGAALVVAIVLFFLLNPCWVAWLAIAILFLVAAMLLQSLGQALGCFGGP
jgi:hypothetical protein